MTDRLDGAIWGTLSTPNESDSNGESANVVDGLFAIARGLDAVAVALTRLGNNDADTHMGAIESMGLTIAEALTSVASAIGEQK